MPPSLKEFEHISYGQGNEIEKALGDARHQRSDVGNGICFSLCCQWIELHKEYHGMGAGEQYRIDSMQKRMRSLMADSIYFYRAMNSQATDYAQQYTSKLEQKNATGKKYNLKFDAETRVKSIFEVEYFQNRTHMYSQLSFQIGTIGRHAICAYKSGGKLFGIGSHLYVFDPNFGEYRVASGKISDFYMALFGKYRQKITNIVLYRVGFSSN